MGVQRSRLVVIDTVWGHMGTYMICSNILLLFTGYQLEEGQTKRMINSSSKRFRSFLRNDDCKKLKGMRPVHPVIGDTNKYISFLVIIQFSITLCGRPTLV